MSEDQDSKKRYTEPRSAYNPIPTIAEYRNLQERRDAANHPISSEPNSPTFPTRDASEAHTEKPVTATSSNDRSSEDKNKQTKIDTTQVVGNNTGDATQKRKEQKKKTVSRVGREVTDPVTHLPVTIHDFTDADLEKARAEQAARESNAIKNSLRRSKSNQSYEEDIVQEQQTHTGMENLFPPPEFEDAREELARIYRTALSLGLGFNMIMALVLFLVSGTTLDRFLSKSSSLTRGLASGTIWTSGLAISAASIWALQDWAKRKVRKIWDHSTWEAEKRSGVKPKTKEDEKHYQSMLNTLVGSVWPVMNPDLFSSLADMVEDIMQASLPKTIRMVSIEDLGQGSVPLRILDIRPLPKGAAAKSVSADGKLELGDNKSQGGTKSPSNGTNDRSDPKDSAANDSSAQSGMVAEEGEFINLEVAFSYSAVKSQKSNDRRKNAHIYMAFYLPGNIKLPVWVELQGMVGIIRARLQLTPDPPFLGLCTMTFLGQPKVDLSCVPLVRKGMNIMDVPLISNFVQSAIDAATAEYVAPKSISLDLKAMLAGEDFKKDTMARGVLIVNIKRAFNFRAGDEAIPLIKAASSDPYISISWAKFGKPIWTSRVLLEEMHPFWNETAYILVGPEELNAAESLRVQLWDSDRTTADDDLGRIEIEVKELMENPKSKCNMWDRTDDFESMKSGESVPGSLEWSVGYYPKTELEDWQVEKARSDSVKGSSKIKTVAQLKEKITAESKRKLRESAKDETAEMDQQAQEDFQAAEIDLIAGSPPSNDYPSGILSIQIHQITGLNITALNQDRDSSGDKSIVQDDHESLPSSYCTIILNHQKIYRTRTKPKNSQPFFNATCERFVRDWRTAEILVAVRNRTVHEDDALMGIVHLALDDTFTSRSQTCEAYPLAGGVGHGKIRISLVFRPIKVQLPQSALGWDIGTLEITPEATTSNDSPPEIKSHKIEIRTSITKRKMYPQSNSTPAKWAPKSPESSLLIPITRRYATNLLLSFVSRSHSLHLPHLKSSSDSKSSPYAILPLSTLTDHESTPEDIQPPTEHTLSLHTSPNPARAQANTLPASEMGPAVGSLTLHTRFWPGLGSVHARWARKNRDMAEVLEALGAAGDEEEEGLRAAGAGAESSSSSDSEGSGGSAKKAGSTEKNGVGAVKDKVKGFASRQDALHRQNRGAMQWQGPRTLRWMKHKMEHLGERVSGRFDLDREPDVETEA